MSYQEQYQEQLTHSTWRSVISYIVSQAESNPPGKDYQQISSGANRHGALEWVLHRSDDLKRYAFCAVVPEVSSTSGTIEISAGASDGERYVKRVIFTARQNSESMRQDSESIPVDGIIAELRSAMSEADNLTVGDLTEYYPSGWRVQGAGAKA